MSALRNSYVVGPNSPPLIELTLGDALDQAASRWPTQDALVSVHQNLRLSYADLKNRAERLAAGLMRIGVSKGDRVGIWAPNCAEWTITQFATAKIGAILVNINPAYKTSELQFALRNVGVSVLIAQRSHKSSDYADMLEALAPEICLVRDNEPIANTRLPDLKHAVLIDDVPRPGWIAFHELAERISTKELNEIRSIQSALLCSDPINIQFTSGTTGLPKGATLSHRNIINNGYHVGQRIGLREGDRLCIPVPLYHCFGMVMGNLACISFGATMIYPAPSFDPLSTLGALQNERCTALYGVPTMFIAILAHEKFNDFDLSSLRTGCMAGSPCPVATMRNVVEEMNMRDVTIAYGMTETSPVSFQSSPDDPIDIRVRTIGKVMPHIECKIVDEHGATVPTNTPGELCTRGYSVMMGYWGDAEKTRSVIDRDGWMHTGDLAVIDDSGYGAIVGRIKDIIIRGGENIYPLEIEEFISTHPAVEDVTVLGVPDEKYGEEVCAWIKLKSGASINADELRKFCRGKIAHYKVPRYVKFVTSFPLTVTGKVRKVDIRKIMVQTLRGSDSNQ